MLKTTKFPSSVSECDAIITFSSSCIKKSAHSKLNTTPSLARQVSNYKGREASERRGNQIRLRVKRQVGRGEGRWWCH